MILHKLAGHSAAVALLATSGAAFAETRASADLTANAGYSTDPYGGGGNNSGSATFAGTFAPTLTTTSPTGSLTLGGQITRTEFTQRYSGTTDYSVNANARQQVSTLTSLTASAGYSSQIRNGLYPILSPGSIPGLDPTAPILVDPAAGGSYAERTEIFTGNVGVGTSLSPRDTLNVFARGSIVRFPRGSVASRGYDSYGGGLSYMRAIGSNSSVGVSFSAGHDRYQSGFGKTTQYSPSVVYQTQLSGRWSLNASAGVTFSETKLPLSSFNDTSFSGSLGVCHKGDRSNFCFNGSRGVSASALDGSSTVTSLGATYGYALTPRSNINAGISYSRASGLLGGRDTDYASANVGYNRQLLRRLSLVVSASYNESYDSFIARGANFYGSVGLRYRLGDI